MDNGSKFGLALLEHWVKHRSVLFYGTDGHSQEKLEDVEELFRGPSADLLPDDSSHIKRLLVEAQRHLSAFFDIMGHLLKTLGY